jgi:uncharacterized protein YecE (DUF72 family)
MTPMGSQIRIGASGFSYKEWVGRFYPPKTPGARMLSYYAEHLPTVEINYTFRAMPKRSMLEGWAAKTPAYFRFALKAPQRITHFARLRGVEDSLNYFIDTAGALGDRLGPILFQLPPDFVRDDVLLADFLAQLGGRLRPAFEFRHRSWFHDEVFGILRANRAALCIAETEKLSTPIVSTAPHAYLRLRREDYDAAALASWAAHIRTLAGKSDEVYVYFKHEAMAPDLAARLQQLVAQP